MFIIECLPFSKGLNKESLSYFSAKSFEPGTLLKINLRGKNISALVLESRDAVEAKSEIKSADFSLKKITTMTAKPFLQKEFLEAVRETVEYFATTQGAVLSDLIPSFVLENPNLLSLSKSTSKGHPLGQNSSRVTLGEKVLFDSSILQTPDEERFAHYRSLVREEFAKKKSVFLCLPQNEDIKQAKEKLERGIESFVCVFHKDISKKELKEEYKKAISTAHPVLIIATSQWLFLARNDLGAIVMDKENENGWKTLSRPFIDLRFFTEILASKKNIRCIIGDSFLRIESLYRYKQGEVSEFENVKWRLPTNIKTNVVDLRTINKKDLPAQAGKEFKSLSLELLNLIKETKEKNSHIFIFAARKGLSSVTVCRDCGEQVKCNNCSAPMILYKTKDGGAFKCHQCSETRNAAEVCQNCGSWKLAAFGSGIDKVSEEIIKNFPDIKLFELNKDTASTSIRAQKIIKNFYENKGSVLLGTEMAFSYLHKKVASTAIASFDSLFSIPDFRIREKIFRLILQTKELAREKFLIQTRNPNDPTVEFAVSGNLIEFYKKEIEDRQALGYPPFGIFIKITARGSKNFVARETENLKNIFNNPENQNYNPSIFPSIHEKKGEQSAFNAVIKMPKENWPDQNLLKILKSLPLHFEIKVDPDNLL